MDGFPFPWVISANKVAFPLPDRLCRLPIGAFLFLKYLFFPISDKLTGRVFPARFFNA